MAAKVTPIGRVSYPQVFTAKAYKNNKPKFSLTLMFDKATDLSAMEADIQDAIKEQFGDDLPETLRSPIRDGDVKNRKGEHPEYAGKRYITFKANEDRRPCVVDGKKQPIKADDPEGFYPGCYARVAYSCYAYDNQGNSGVAFGLSHIQKVRDGERLDGGVSVDNAFDALDDADDSIF